MDPLKKRKFEENGIVKAEPDTFVPLLLNADDARKILEPFTREQLLQIVQNAFFRHPDVLEAVRLIADRDVAQRKLFVRGLGWETTSEKLQSLFASYGELEEAVVILDKTTGKSKGYGFVTFKHVDGAILASKEPSKKIDGRMTVTQLAAAGVSGGSGGTGTSGAGGLNNPVDISMRKIYVGNVPYDMPAERILQRFSMYGEVEEGPLGFDKETGKSKGFALFVYKTAEAARAALVDPVKNIDGHQLNCKLAIDGKRGKPPPTLVPAGPIGVQGSSQGNGDGIGSAVPGAPYGGPGGIGGPYGGFSGSLGAGVGGGAPGLPAIGSQPVGGGFNPGIGGPYSGSSHYGGHGGTGYGGLSGAGNGLGGAAGLGGGFGGGLSGAGGRSGGVPSGLGPAGRGSSMYGLPPSSAGMGSGDYPGSAHYSLSSGGYQGQHNIPSGASAAPRIPPGGAYQGMPPYY